MPFKNLLFSNNFNIIWKIFLYRGVEKWYLVGLITRRSQVQFLSPQPNQEIKLLNTSKIFISIVLLGDKISSNEVFFIISWKSLIEINLLPSSSLKVKAQGFLKFKLKIILKIFSKEFTKNWKSQKSRALFFSSFFCFFNSYGFKAIVLNFLCFNIFLFCKIFFVNI